MNTSTARNALVVWLLCLNSFAFGRSDFEPAIIVNNNGDSLYGKIDYRNWKKNPENIYFINGANEKQTFDAHAIKSFYIIKEQERYISHNVKIDMASDNYLKAASMKITKSSFVEKRVFLLQIIRSHVLGLYLYADNNKNHFYYTKENEEPVELIYHYLYIENSSQVEAETTYKQQLSDLMSSCIDVIQKTDRLHYTEKEIKHLVIQYLKCNNGAEVAEIKKDDPLPVRFGVVGGVMYNRFKFEGNGHITSDNYSDIAIDNYSSNTSPVIGTSIDVGLQRVKNKWHIINESGILLMNWFLKNIKRVILLSLIPFFMIIQMRSTFLFLICR